MWELDCEEGWAPKNWWFWSVVLEKTLESPLDFKEIQPVYPKGDQSWVFIGRTEAESETRILSPPHAKGWLIGKDPAAGRDWWQEEKGTTEDEMAGWHHWLDGRESEWTLGVGDGQEAWRAATHGVIKSQTRLKDSTELKWIMQDVGGDVLKTQRGLVLCIFITILPGLWGWGEEYSSKFFLYIYCR